MSNTQNNMELLEKACRVLNSCETSEQLDTAQRWLGLACRRAKATFIYSDLRTLWMSISLHHRRNSHVLLRCEKTGVALVVMGN